MDIDSFLDREMGAQQKGKAEPEASGEAAALLSSIQYLLAQKQFDQIEASYDSLWKKVSQSGFSWDRSLYDELVTIHGQIARETAPAFQDASKRIQIMRQMVAQARTLLSARQVDGAAKLQNEVAAMMAEIPGLFFQEKKAMEKEVLRLQRDVHDAQSAADLQKVSMLQREIMQQSARLRPFLLSGNVAAATQQYARLLSLYQQLPPGFLGIKLGLGREMAEMYKSLAIQQEIERLRQQLNPIAQRRFGALQQPSHPVAERHRRQARELLAGKEYDAALAQVNALLSLIPDDQEGRDMLERIQAAKRVA
ncbi:TPA: hypothetical protein HA295_02555 [Candidatus Woesearchaeota archaeon]|nr:hypothetical protein [Candidatus Woesearchaeota archaeon]HII65634.1 hypothetical protein [Candidatus Woesearchaeota archaeon]